MKINLYSNLISMIRLKEIIGSVIIVLVSILLPASCNRQAEKTVDEMNMPAGNITLSEAQMQLANIQLSQVSESEFATDLELTGALKVNEQSAVTISSRSTGRILRLFYKNTGETVHKGDSLYEIYSEELVAAEREYFTLHSNNWNLTGRYGPSLTIENKLLFLGMTPAQIDQLKKDGRILYTLKIQSPAGGIIRSVNITEGQYVNVGETLFELADNKTLWAEARVYTNDQHLLKVGMPVTVNLPVGLGIEVRSSICFINPSAEEGKNLSVVRAIVDNRDKNLYPGMFTILRVQVQKSRGIILPASAVIPGRKESRIWVQNNDGSFSPRLVTTAGQSMDSILITSGINKEETVVTSGAYLLDSELILKKGSLGTNMEMQ